MASYKTVSYGSSDKESVTELQKKLNENGANLDVDGVFGSQTQAALKKYQTDNGLTVDGIAGEQTWSKLNAAPAVPEATQPAQKTNVEQAKELLDQVTGAKPKDYSSQWTEQLDQLTQQNLNRQPFSYDINGDVLLQQAQDRYLQQGKMSMLDTMGEAAGLTGGYGSSYAQQVGQQTYQGYLQGINDMIPEYYDRAKAAYDQEGQELKDRLSLVAGLEAQDYERHQAEQDAWMAERDYLTGRYDSERAFEYQQEQDKIAQDQWERQFAASQRSSGGSGVYKTGDTYTSVPQSLIDKMHEAAVLGDQDELVLLAKQLGYSNYDPNVVYSILSGYGLDDMANDILYDANTGMMGTKDFNNLSGEVRTLAFRGNRQGAEKLIVENADNLTDEQLEILYKALDNI